MAAGTDEQPAGSAGTPDARGGCRIPAFATGAADAEKPGVAAGAARQSDPGGQVAGGPAGAAVAEQ